MAGGNLGNLWYELGIKEQKQGALDDYIAKLKQIGKDIDVKVNFKGDAETKIANLEQALQKLKTESVDVKVNATTDRITVSVMGIDLPSSVLKDLADKVNAGLAQQSFKIMNFDTTALQTAVANAVKNAVDTAKPSIMQKIKEAISNGSQKVKLDVDAKQIAKQIANGIESANIKLTNLKVDNNTIIKSIQDALNSKKFNIDIAINKMEIANAVQHALTQAGYKNVMNYSASDARLDKAANDAMIAQAKQQLLQEKLHKAQLDTARAAERNANAHNRLQREVSNTTMAVNVLGNAMGNVFSVYAVKNFAQEIIQVGGELEKMRLAMGSIMGDTYKADTIFKQVSDLSMVSPFDVQDLVQYTKQLNAFGIQYSDLYDTTKRLSDIAAATGVSFGRIAYEFGQTSARGWLDGRELRMFANSGIPLLQKLSDYYTKTMGKIVSSSDVREMVTKRKVSFDDVRKVLWQLTDEGGAFYQMQEVMAESLSAKWVNLANDWNLMLGQIAESGAGDGLKRIAEGLMTLVENWKVVGGAIMPVVGYLGLYNFAQALANKQALAGAVAQRTFGEALSMSGKYISGISKAFLTNPATWAVAAVAAISAVVFHHIDKMEQAEKRKDEILKKANEGTRNLDQIKVSPTFTVTPKNESEYKQAIKQMADTIRDYAPDAGGIFKNIFGDADTQGLKTMREQYDALKTKINELSESYKVLVELKSIFNVANNATDGAFDESMLDNLKDVQNEYRTLDTYIGQFVKTQGIIVTDLLAKARESSAEFTASVTNSIGELMSPQTQLRTLLLEYRDLFNSLTPKQESNLGAGSFSWLDEKASDRFSTLRAYVNDFDDAVNTANADITVFADNIEKSLGDIRKDIPGFNLLTEEGQQRAVTMAITASLQDDVQNPYARQLLYNELIKRKIILQPDTATVEDPTKTNNPNPDKPKGDPELDKWKERFKFLKEAYAEYKRWYDLYNNSEKAIDKTKENPLFADLDVDPSALWKNLDALSKQVKTNTKKRREFQLQVEGEKVTITYNNDKDSIAKAVSDMKEQIDRETKNWNLYQKLFDATGDKQWAKQISFGEDLKILWDEQTEKMRKDLGLGDVIDWSMSEEKAKETLKDGSIVEAYMAIKKKIEENYINFWGTYATNAKSLQSLDAQLTALANKRKELLRNAPENADTKVVTGDIDKQIDDLRVKRLKQNLNWDALLGNAKVIERDLLTGARKAMKDFRKTKEFAAMNPLSQESINEAIRSMSGAINSKGGFFGGLSESLKEFEYATNELMYAQIAYNKALVEGKDSEIALAEQRLTNAKNGVYSAQGQVLDSKNTAFKNAKTVMNAATTLANSGDHALAAVGNVISAIGPMLSSTGEMWSSIIGAILQLLDAIGDDFKGFLGDLMDSIMHAVGGIIDTISEFDPVMSALGVGYLFHGADYSEYEKMMSNLENMRKIWDDVISKKKEYIETSWGEEAAAIGAESLEYIKKAIEDEKKAAETILGSGASSGSHSINYRMWGGSYRDIDGKNWYARANQANFDKYYGTKELTAGEEILVRMLNSGKEMSYMLELSGEELQILKEEFGSTWAAMNDDFRKHLETIIQYDDKVKEVEESVEKRITQTSFDSLRDQFVDALMDMEMESKDFTKNFTKMMMNAMVNNKLLGNGFDDWLNGWWESMESAVTAGDLDAQNKLNKEADEKRLSLLEERDRIASVLGYTGDGESSSSVSSGIKSITEQTADLLASYVNGIRADVSISRSILESIDLPSLSAVATSQLAQLNMIAANTEAIMNSNNDIRDDLRDIRSDFSATLNGTKKMYIQ